MSRNKQGAWTGGSTRHFSPRKPHRSKKHSPNNILAQDSGPVPNDSSHIREHCLRAFSAGSVSPIALVLSNPDLDLFKGRRS
jgi:hypothetical protein